MAKPKTKIFLDPELVAPHFSTRIFKGYHLYLKKILPQQEVVDFFLNTGLPLDYIEGDQNWVSEKYAEIFYRKIKTLPNIDPRFSFLAARESLSREALGPLISLALRLQSPKTVYNQILHFTKQYNRVDTLSEIELGSNFLHFTLKLSRKTDFEDDILDNWKGFLTYIPSIFGGSEAAVSVTRPSSGTFCFEVKWAAILGTAINFGALLVGIGIASLLLNQLQPGRFSSGIGILDYWGPLILVSLGFVLQIMANLAERKKIDQDSRILLQEAEKRYLEIFENKEKLDRRYREANLLRQVITTITKAHNEGSLISTTIEEVRDRLKYDRVAYFSKQTASDKLSVAKTKGFSPEIERKLSTYQIDLNQKTPNKFHLGNVFKDGKSILVPVASDYVDSLSDEGRALITGTQTQSFLAVPVRSDKESFGILLVDYCQADKKLTQDDLHIIENVTIQLGIAIQNVRNYENEKQLRLTFQKFVPEPVLKKILGGQAETLKTGFKKNVVVLFSDLRDFTKNSTSTKPEDLVEILNTYFNEMTRLVYENGGIVDKFLGDGLFAIFNAFDNFPDLADRALRCSLQMQKTISEVNQNFFVQKQGVFPELRAGIGLHYGPVTLCTLGNDEKTEFTAIGETVNLAARLESKSKDFPNFSVIFSEDVKKLLTLQEPTVHRLGPHSIRGLSHDIELFGAGQRESLLLSQPSAQVLKFQKPPPPKLRFQNRDSVGQREPFFLVGRSGTHEFKGRIRDISSFGCRFQPEMPSSIFGESLNNVKIFLNEAEVGSFESSKVVRHLESGEVAIEFDSNGPSVQKRSRLRVPAIPGFECHAHFSHPLKFDSNISLSSLDFSADGASFISSARNNIFFRNLKIDKLNIDLKGLGSIQTPFVIKSVKAIGADKIRIGGRFETKLSDSSEELLGLYLACYGAISHRPRIERLFEAGLAPRELKKIVDFSTFQPLQDISEALKVRAKAYGKAGKFNLSQSDKMTDIFDRNSYVVLARLSGESVGTVRVTLAEKDEERFELEDSIEIPADFQRSKTMEVSRLAVDPAYQKSDLVLGLVQRAIELSIKLDAKYVVTSCTEEKIGIYKKLGFSLDPKPFNLKTLDGIPHYLLTMKTQDVVPTGSANPLSWHFTYKPVVDFLKKFGHYSGVQVSWGANLMGLLLPILKILLFRKRKTKSSKLKSPPELVPHKTEKDISNKNAA